MSAYRGRTGPNFSEYLNGLNTSNSPVEDEQFAESLDINSDLAMFTNTDFTHFDIPNLPDDSNFNFDLGADKPENVKYEELLGAPDQSQSFNGPSIDTSAADAAQFYSNYNTPIQPAPAHTFPGLDNRIPGASGAASRGDESAEVQAFSPEDKSRVAAEEDKRRRNTAASARFRVKKKQREQALEKSVKDIHDRNAKLESKVNQLEMENKWLKDLITEKNAVPSREEIDAAFQKFKRESEERDSEHSEHTTGVGTK